MKKIYLFIFIFFTSNVFADAPIAYFDQQTKQWIKQDIFPMASINKIISAGKYAWAIGDQHTTFAFYDGQQWSTATKITGINKIIDFYPGFPISGVKSTGWALGTNANNNTIVAYFDGAHWGTTTIIATNMNGGAQISASAGTAWLTYMDNDMIMHFMIANEQNPNKWTAINNAPHWGIAVSNNDKTVGAYILGSDSFLAFNNSSLIQYKADGIPNILQNNLTRNGLFGLLSINDDILASITLSTRSNVSIQNVILYSHDAGKTWASLDTTKIPGSIVDTIEPYARNYSNGIYCNNPYQATLISNIQFSCIDTKQSNPTWKTGTLASSFKQSQFFSITNKDGALIVYIMPLDPKQKSYIFRYNINSDQLIDTQINTVASYLLGARAINSREILACGYLANDKLAAFYYDGSQWTTTPFTMPPHIYYCGISTSVEPYVTPDQKVWVYGSSEYLTNDITSQNQKLKTTPLH